MLYMGNQKQFHTIKIHIIEEETSCLMDSKLSVSICKEESSMPLLSSEIAVATLRFVL